MVMRISGDAIFPVLRILCLVFPCLVFLRFIPGNLRFSLFCLVVVCTVARFKSILWIYVCVVFCLRVRLRDCVFRRVCLRAYTCVYCFASLGLAVTSEYGEAGALGSTRHSTNTSAHRPDPISNVHSATIFMTAVCASSVCVCDA